MIWRSIYKMAHEKLAEGVFAINKPYGMSSAQVIRDCQHHFNPSKLFAPLLAADRALREKENRYQQRRRTHAKRDINVKIGHGGTLDPLATGILILGVGKGTKALHDFLGCTKTYETVVVFGASTDTYDRVGKLIKKGDYSNITREQVEEALNSFRGKFQQMPPLYSALKMNGKPLYEYAREGKPIPREIETREVDVTELELTEWYEPGTHNHRWPTEEAEQAEKNVVKSVWQVAKNQQDGTTSTEEAATLIPEVVEKEVKALADHESNKRAAEERVDELVSEEPAGKKRKTETGAAEPMMSGALKDKKGKDKKQDKYAKNRGLDLAPPPPSPDTPFPWEGKGPPAAKIRMTVTSGFYVRSLCHELGEKLGCGAMMAELVRSRQGEFVLGTDNCMEYSDLALGEDVWAPKIQKALDLWNNKDKAGKAQAVEPVVKKEEPKTEEVKTEEIKAEKIKAEEQPAGEVKVEESAPVKDEETVKTEPETKA
ncbi:pseudouridine synthase [Neurospora tetraspora]|uniref:tRNA pseudouridine(55) synthase n=1 Tax=Neurospora tetraspora TaxID=94610 RepID=A0AAE0JLV0_9PEZI|nr:pseudouridine synthase [Neurospora tetraspora]